MWSNLMLFQLACSDSLTVGYRCEVARLRQSRDSEPTREVAAAVVRVQKCCGSADGQAYT